MKRLLKTFILYGILISLSLAQLQANDGTPLTNNEIIVNAGNEIYIYSDEQLLQLANSSGWAGNGSAQNPISIINFMAEGFNTKIGLSIRNTRLHINISQVNIKFYSTGISIYNASNVLVEQSYFQGYTTSILIEESSNITVSRNEFIGGNQIISIIESMDVNIEYNRIYDGGNGLLVDTSTNTVIRGNNISDLKGDGIETAFSTNTLFIGNYLSNLRGTAITNKFGEDNKIMHNVINGTEEDGIFVKYGKDMYYYNNTIRYSLMSAITIQLTTNITVMNSSFLVSYSGFDVINSSGIVINSTFAGNEEHASEISTTEELKILNSTFDSNYIALRMATQSPKYIEVRGNVFSNNHIAIQSNMSMFAFQENTFTNNTRNFELVSGGYTTTITTTTIIGGGNVSTISSISENLITKITTKESKTTDQETTSDTTPILLHLTVLSLIIYSVKRKKQIR